MFSAKTIICRIVSPFQYREMNINLKMNSLLLMLLLLFFIVSGCGGKEIIISYDPKAGVPEGYGIKTPLNTAVIPYQDKRTGISSGKKIADISANVAGVHGSELLLKDDDVSALVTKAVKDQFSHLGHKAVIVSGVSFDKAISKTPSAAIPSDSDIVIAGEIKRFHLDVAGRDKIEIELTTYIASRKDGRLLWSGTTVEEGDRFAGVMGNTKGSIEKYINYSLTKVIKKMLKESEPALMAFIKSPATSAIAVDLPLPAEPSKTSPLPPQLKENGIQSKGTLVVTSMPAGARFYINDTYYGKTPINIELKAGVYEITVKLKGFRDEKEKVAVRPGTSTELEVFLEGK